MQIHHSAATAAEQAPLPYSKLYDDAATLLPHGEQRTFSVIARMASKSGVCTASNKTIASKIKQKKRNGEVVSASVRTVQNHKSVIAATGLITIYEKIVKDKNGKRRQTTNAIVINWNRLQPDADGRPPVASQGQLFSMPQTADNTKDIAPPPHATRCIPDFVS